MDIDFKETPRVVLCIGKPKKGKSNAIKYWVLKNTIKQPVFQIGIIFSRTGGMGREYDYVPDEYVHQGYDEGKLGAYINELEKYVKKHGRPVPNFVVFDDLLGLLNKRDPFLMNFLAVHRHLGCTVFMAFQHLNYGTSTTMREICTHAVLFSSKSFNTMRSLFENFGTMFKDYRAFKKAFFHITGNKWCGMLYIQEEDDILKNYMSFCAPNMDKYNYKIKY